MKIYVASSWKNQRQLIVVHALRKAGFEVYNFRDHAGFYWGEIDPDFESWDARATKAGLQHPLAEAAFKVDMGNLQSSDACVMVTPCGVSASLELGWASGAGLHTAILMTSEGHPEVMFKMADHMATSLEELVEWFQGL